jgi:hypothetical protein
VPTTRSSVMRIRPLHRRRLSPIPLRGLRGIRTEDLPWLRPGRLPRGLLLGVKPLSGRRGCAGMRPLYLALTRYWTWIASWTGRRSSLVIIPVRRDRWATTSAGEVWSTLGRPRTLRLQPRRIGWRWVGQTSWRLPPPRSLRVGMVSYFG